MKEVAVNFHNNEAYLSGNLIHSTVGGALEQCAAVLPNQKAITFNFSQVVECDSSSLAFLLALLRKAQLQKVTIKFCSLPKQMRDLAKVSGINNFSCFPPP